MQCMRVREEVLEKKRLLTPFAFSVYESVQMRKEQLVEALYASLDAFLGGKRCSPSALAELLLHYLSLHVVL